MDQSDMGDEIVSHDDDVQESDLSRVGIAKRRPLEMLTIPDTAFEEALGLCIQEKKLDKNGGVYKYVFVCRHAGKFHSNKTATDPSQQCNRESIKTDCTCYINMCWLLKSSNPAITKMNLEHHGHVLSPETIRFAN
ncbi:9484_t:CDS:2, partial [Cetraspora pellucida]